MANNNDEIYGSIERRYDILRRREEQKARAAAGEQQSALKRRFAAIGGLGSGAYIKQMGLAEERGAGAAAGARESVEMGRMAEIERQRQIEQQRAFQTAERMGSQEFAAGEAGKQRSFITGERESGQVFATKERLSAQDFARTTQGIALDAQEKLFNKSLDFKEKTLQFQDFWNEQNNMLATRGMDLEEKVTNANLLLQTMEMLEKFKTDNPDVYAQALGIQQSAFENMSTTWGNLPSGAGPAPGGVSYTGYGQPQPQSYNPYVQAQGGFGGYYPENPPAPRTRYYG